MARNKRLSLVRPAPAKPESQSENYGWKPQTAQQQRAYAAYDTWLIYQARSILGKRHVSLDEARELFSRIDPTTRQPVVQETPPRWGWLQKLVG